MTLYYEFCITVSTWNGYRISGKKENVENATKRFSYTDKEFHSRIFFFCANSSLFIDYRCITHCIMCMNSTIYRKALRKPMRLNFLHINNAMMFYIVHNICKNLCVRLIGYTFCFNVCFNFVNIIIITIKEICSLQQIFFILLFCVVEDF